MRSRMVRLLVLVAAALPVAGAGPARVNVDRAWSHPDSSRFALRRIALLPAVTLSADWRTMHFVADRWAAPLADDERDLIPPLACFGQFAPARAAQESVQRVIAEQVRRDGRTDVPTTRALARRLRADALLLVRVDRWEQQAGAREMTYVDLAAALVDSGGTLLWRGEGRSRLEALPAIPDESVPAPARGVRVEQEMRPGSAPTSGSGSGSPPGGQPGGGQSGGGGLQTEQKIHRDGFRDEPPRPAPAFALAETGLVPAAFRAAVDSLVAALAVRIPPRPARSAPP